MFLETSFRMSPLSMSGPVAGYPFALEVLLHTVRGRLACYFRSFRLQFE